MRKEDKSILKKLFSINLIYAYPMLTSQAKKKSDKKKKFDFAKKVRNTYMLGIVFVLLMYIVFSSFLDFEQTPILLDCFVGAFIVMSLMQNFTYFFNVFYESKDIESYMALPIKESTVFLSKLLTVSFTALQLSVPILAMLFIFFIKMGKSIIYASIFSVIDFLLLFLVSILLNMIIMLVLAKVNILYKYKNILTVAMMLVAMVINISTIILIQVELKEAILKKFFTGVETRFLLSNLTINIEGQLIFIGFFGILTATLLFIVYKMMAKGFYNTILKINRISSNDAIKKEVAVKKRGVIGSLWKQNLNLLKDGTMLAQIIIMELMFLIIILSNIFIAGEEVKWYFMEYAQYILPIIALSGVFLGNTGNNFAAFCVSLDREVYNFYKSLPIARKTYVLFKIAFASVVQNILVFLAIIGIGVYLEVSVFDIVLSEVFALTLGISVTALWVVYDFKHLLLDWTSTTQLMTKVGKVIPFILLITGMFAIGFFAGGVAVVSEYVTVWQMYVILYLVSLILCGYSFSKVRKLIKTNP